MFSCMLTKQGVELGLDLQTPEQSQKRLLTLGRVKITEWLEFGRALNFSAFC